MKKFFLLSWLLLFSLISIAQVTPSLWTEYKDKPNAHPNIPNCSYAGYQYGDKALPEGNGTIFNVKDYSAKGDNATDDTEAIRNAIKAAEDAGGGIVYLPNGKYICSGVLFINASNVIIRGESCENTIIYFTKSLTDCYAPNYTGGAVLDQIAWSWAGGLIWITPRSKNTYLPTMPDNLIDTWLGEHADRMYLAEKEAWNTTDKIADITSHEDRGEFSFTVSSAASIKAGDYISIRYKNTADWSLMKYFTGDGTFAANYTWGSGTDWIDPKNRKSIDWVVQVESVSGNKVTLKQPLRIPLRADWEPCVMGMGDLVQESGIENITLELEKDYESQYDNSNWRNANHNREKGWNGIYMNNAVNCFARNVTIYDSETGAGTAASKNITFTGIRVHGKDKKRSSHHGFTCRRQSQDILFENFELLHYNQFDHGINVEDFTMGCVWHSGIVVKGCFDTHKLVPAECLRTNIKVDVGGGYGGSGEAGPQIGARFVHWNVEIKGSAKNTITPATTMPMGAIVGIVGDNPSSSTASGCRVEACNLAVEPADLYVGQKELRNGVVQPTSLATPWKVWDVPSRIEAEDAKFNTISIDNDSYDDGSQLYLHSFNNPDGYAEYDINVPISGKYKVDFRVCSEDRGENYLSIIERGVEIGHISFNGTGRGGDNWRTISTTLLLNPGVHTLQLRGTKGMTCLNYLRVNEATETSTVPFPQFETIPGKYNGFVSVSLIEPQGVDVYYRIDGKGSSFSSYTGPIELTSSATIITTAKCDGKWSLENSGYFEVKAPETVPCRILAINYTDQNGMSIQNASPNDQLSVGQTGDWVKYYVSVPEEGLYQINTRISIKLRDGVTSTGFEVYSNGERVGRFADLPNMGGNWDRFKIYPTCAYLKEGINEIRLVALNRRFNFDWIEIFSAANKEVPAIIEAEEYDYRSSGYGLHRTIKMGGGREPGYEVAINTDSKLFYPIKVNVTGAYPITFVVCSRDANGRGRLSMYETGEELCSYKADQVSGSEYESQHEFTVTLQKGAYTLCLEQPSGGEHYVEKIIIGEPVSTDPDDNGYTGEQCIEVSDHAMKPFVRDNWIVVGNETPTQYNVINTMGYVMITGECSTTCPVNINSLPTGIYFFSTNEYPTLKIAKK